MKPKRQTLRLPFKLPACDYPVDVGRKNQLLIHHAYAHAHGYDRAIAATMTVASPSFNRTAAASCAERAWRP